MIELWSRSHVNMVQRFSILDFRALIGMLVRTHFTSETQSQLLHSPPYGLRMDPGPSTVCGVDRRLGSRLVGSMPEYALDEQ